MVLASLLFQGGTLFTLMLAVPFSVPMMALAGAVLGVTFSVITVLWDTLLQVHVPPELLARVYSYDFLGSTAAIPIGTAIIGTLASNYGAREVLIGAAAGVLDLGGGAQGLILQLGHFGLQSSQFGGGILGRCRGCRFGRALGLSALGLGLIGLGGCVVF